MDGSYRWASDSLGKTPVELMKGLLDRIPVSLMGASPVLGCSVDNRIDKVLNRPRLADFDHLPARDGREIVGVVSRAMERDRDRPAGTRVRDAMQPLSESMLMAADAPLITFVECADKRRFSLLVRDHKIVAIVTLSDLQKIAVRPALFSLVALLEMLLAKWICHNFSDEQWLTTLGPKLKKDVERRFDQLRDGHLAVNKITATYISEKVALAGKLEGFPGGGSADPAKELAFLAGFRNSVNHHHDFAEDESNAELICQRVRTVRNYINLLNKAMPKARGA